MYIVILISTHSWRVFVWLLGWSGHWGKGGGGKGGGDGRGAAPYCKPAVAASEALLTVPSKFHLLTHLVKYTERQPRSYTQKHTEAEQVWGCVSCASGLGFSLCVFWSCLSCVSPLVFLFKSGQSPPAGLLSERWKKREGQGGVLEEGREGGAERGHVSEWEKITVHHVVTPTDWDSELTRQSKVNNTHGKDITFTMAVKKPAPAHTNTQSLHLVLMTWPVAHMERPVSRTDGQNATTRSWTEPLSTQMGHERTNADWWRVKSDNTQDRQTNSFIIRLAGQSCIACTERLRVRLGDSTVIKMR